MDTSSITGTFRDINSVLAPLGGFALLASFMWVVWRTRSAHPLRQRVWALIFGKGNLNDDLIKGFVEDRTNLMSFRFIAGVRVRTLQQAHDLIAWLKANDEEVGTIRTIDAYFDLERMEVAEEKVRKAWVLTTLAFGLASLIVACAPALMVGYDKVILRMKQSGTWFVVQASTAPVLSLPFATPSMGLTHEDCTRPAADLAMKTRFPIGDIPVVCELLSSDSAPSYLRSTLLAQRIAFGLLALMIGFFFGYQPLRAVHRITEAKHLLIRLERRQRQLSLDLR